MRVIEDICNRVAVLEKGKVVELGDVAEVFANPKTLAAKRLILTRQSEVAMSRLSEEGTADGV